MLGDYIESAIICLSGEDDEVYLVISTGVSSNCREYICEVLVLPISRIRELGGALNIAFSFIGGELCSCTNCSRDTPERRLGL